MSVNFPFFKKLTLFYLEWFFIGLLFKALFQIEKALFQLGLLKLGLLKNCRLSCFITDFSVLRQLSFKLQVQVLFNVVSRT